MKKLLVFVFSMTTLLATGQSLGFDWVRTLEADDPASIYISSIKTDNSGNCYINGTFSNIVDFDPGPAIHNLSSTGPGLSDMFLLKLDANGNFQWVKQIGGSQTIGSYAASLLIDKSGNIYITGDYTGEVDFDPGSGTFNSTAIGNNDIFILKLDANGNFVWVKNMGGKATEIAYVTVIDEKNNIYTAGVFAGTVDFDPGNGVFDLSAHGEYSNIFITKLDASGNFIWAKSVVGGSGITVSGIGMDASTNIYATGVFSKGMIDFDPGAQVFFLTSEGFGDTFILKLNEEGNFVWAEKIGGNSLPAYSKSIVIDKMNSLYITGSFFGTVDFDPGPGIVNLSAKDALVDVFFLKLDSDGHYIWAKSIGGTWSDYANSTALDKSGNVYTFGQFGATVDFDPNSGTADLTSNGDEDMYMQILNSNGEFKWACNIGGVADDYSRTMTVDPFGNVYSGGTFYSTVDFDPGPGTTDVSPKKNVRIFIHKMSQRTVGINENDFTVNTIIYPNPTSGLVEIVVPKSTAALSDVTIEIYDCIGNSINKTPLEEINRIDLTNQSEGLYFVFVKSNNKIISKGKIIKQ